MRYLLVIVMAVMSYIDIRACAVQGRKREIWVYSILMLIALGLVIPALFMELRLLDSISLLRHGGNPS